MYQVRTTWHCCLVCPDNCARTERSVAADIIVSLYNPAGAPPSLLSSGVEIRRGDYTDPASLRAAFAGADKLLLVSYPSLGAHRVPLHRNAIDAAKAAGITHIYYTSLAFGFGARDYRDIVGEGGPESVAAVMQGHLETEAYLRESGVAYTIVREGIYSEAALVYLGSWRPDGADGSDPDEIVVPHGDGGIAWVDRRDLGEGTAKIMAAVRDLIRRSQRVRVAYS